jgi:hypothetical protein
MSLNFHVLKSTQKDNMISYSCEVIATNYVYDFDYINPQ